MPNTFVWSALSLALLLAAGCGSSSGKSGTGGSPGNSTGGGGGESGGGTGGSGNGGTGVSDGGAAAFMAVAPCDNASDYASGATITFPNADMSYSPKCLKVEVGSTVTFMATAGDFSMHPLEASRRRGDTDRNSITTTQGAMTSRAFTFSEAGFFAYHCATHGASDNGTGMEGVIWVQ